jgi:hypothetical protein
MTLGPAQLRVTAKLDQLADMHLANLYIEIDAYNRTFPGRVDGLGLLGSHDPSRLLQHLHCWRR